MSNFLRFFCTFILMGLIPFSCSNDDDGGCGDGGTIRTFEILNITSQNVHLDNGVTIQDSSFYSWDSVFLKYEVTEKNYITNTEFKNLSFSLSSAAYACTPVPPTSVDELVSVRIIAIEPFASPIFPFDTIKRLESISHLFVGGLGSSPRDDSRFAPMDQPLQSSKISDSESFFLRYNHEPVQNIELNFMTIITFQDGKEIAFGEQQLWLKKS